MTPERALLRRLEQRVFAYDAGNRGGGNYFDDLREIAEAARALLAEPEGEKSSGCPRRQSPQTPCVLEVGPMDADEEGICVGCGMPWEGAVRQQERPTPRSRAEAEAMVDDFGIAQFDCGSFGHGGERPHEYARLLKQSRAARAALLAALTGEEK